MACSFLTGMCLSLVIIAWVFLQEAELPNLWESLQNCKHFQQRYPSSLVTKYCEILTLHWDFRFWDAIKFIFLKMYCMKRVGIEKDPDWYTEIKPGRTGRKPEIKQKEKNATKIKDHSTSNTMQLKLPGLRVQCWHASLQPYSSAASKLIVIPARDLLKSLSLLISFFFFISQQFDFDHTWMTYRIYH